MSNEPLFLAVDEDDLEGGVPRSRGELITDPFDSGLGVVLRIREEILFVVTPVDFNLAVSAASFLRMKIVANRSCEFLPVGLVNVWGD